MQIHGIIKSINETIQISEKFRKRDFVLQTEHTSQYPQFIQLQLIQDKCALIDNYKIDDEVSVDFNLGGRQWTDKDGKVKTFNSLNAWRIELVNSAPLTVQSHSPEIKEETVANNTQPIVNTEQNDDLPF